MWNCIRGCLREALPNASLIFIAGLVAGIIGLVTLSGGVAAVLALGVGAFAKAIGVIAGGVLLADALGTLVGCIAGCLFVRT